MDHKAKEDIKEVKLYLTEAETIILCVAVNEAVKRLKKKKVHELLPEDAKALRRFVTLLKKLREAVQGIAKRPNSDMAQTALTNTRKRK